MSDLLGLLDDRDINTEGKIDDLCKLDYDAFLSFVKEIQDTVNRDNLNIEYSPYNFYANSVIDGIGGCAEIKCSLKRAQEFAVFSSLYTDKTYIGLEQVMNPHLFDIEDAEGDNFIKAKLGVIKELRVLYSMRELIEQKIVNILRPVMLCQNCFQKNVLSEADNRNIDFLVNYYASLVTVEIENNEGVLLLKIHGLEEVLEHNMFFIDNDILPSKIIDKLSNPARNKYTLTTEEIADINIVYDLIHDNYVHGKFDNYLCNLFGTKYLTNAKPLYELCPEMKGKGIDGLDSLSEFSFPFIEFQDAKEMRKIIDLRNSEGESFIKYRNAVISAMKMKDRNSNEKHMREIYEDIILKEFNELDLKIRKQKEKNRFSFLATGALLATVGIGTRLNLTPQDINAYLTLGGLTGVALGIINPLKDKAVNRAELRENDFYFLWKLKNDVKK